MKANDPEGWLEKAKQFTGESEQTIKSELTAKRTAKTKKSAAKRIQEIRQEPAQAGLPLRDMIDTMTNAEEAIDFVRSSPSISQQFLIYVADERKRRKSTKR